MKKFLIFALALLCLCIPLSADAHKKATKGKPRTTATQSKQKRSSKRAFMVGISVYRAHGRDSWGNIHGAEDVAMLKPVLAQQGFDITTLVDEEATYSNIKKSLNQFINNTRTGDIVYLHFSTHGQPVEDGLNGLGKDEADGWDESIVPIDAASRYGHNGYQGDKHLTDDELTVYFERLRNQIGPTGVLYVAMDACHAGGASRGIELNTVRGTNEGLSRSGAIFDPRSGDTAKHYNLKADKQLAPTLFLEACTARQRNSEIRINGKECGSLSYNIKCALEKRPLSKDTSCFKNDVIESTQQAGHWPNRQSLVIEE